MTKGKCKGSDNKMTKSTELRLPICKREIIIDTPIFQYSFEADRVILEEEGVRYVRVMGKIPVKVYAELTLDWRRRSRNDTAKYLSARAEYYHALSRDGTYEQFDPWISLGHLKQISTSIDRTLPAIMDHRTKDVKPELEEMLRRAFPDLSDTILNVHVEIYVNCPNPRDVSNPNCYPNLEPRDVFRNLYHQVTQHLINEALCITPHK